MRGVLDRLRPYRRAIDRWATVYLLVTGVLPLLNPDVFDHVRSPGPLLAVWPHLGLHVFLAVTMWFVPPVLRRQRWAPLRFVGEIYLPLLFPILYAEIEYLGLIFFDNDSSFDPWLIEIEQWLFGLQPSIAWARWWPWPWFHELMEFAYFSYYFFAVGALLMIWRLGRWTAAERWAHTVTMIRALSLVMLTCYVWYIFFPVWGPKYFAKIGVIGPVQVKGYLFTHIMQHIHATGALHGAAFPSSHVAGSMIPWWWAWRLYPRHRWWTTVLWGLLCLSIVYCRYHYAIDLVAGIGWGALMIWVGDRVCEPRPVAAAVVAPPPRKMKGEPALTGSP